MTTSDRPDLDAIAARQADISHLGADWTDHRMDDGSIEIRTADGDLRVVLPDHCGALSRWMIAARTDVPALLAEVRRLTEANAALENSLADMRALERKARAERDRKHDELHTETADYLRRYSAMDARIAEARREAAEQMREQAFRAADDYTIHRPIRDQITARIAALPLSDADPAVCGADVDGHPCVREPDHHDIGPCNNRWPGGVPETEETS